MEGANPTKELEPQVLREIGELHGQVTKLGEVLPSLADRIDGVLHPPVPLKEVNDAPKEDESLCEIAREIKEARMRLQKQVSVVIELRNRVEV